MRPRLPRKIFTALVVPAKLAGLAMLAAHVAFSPDERFDIRFYLLYLAVVAGLSLLWMLGSWAWFRVARLRGMPDIEDEMDRRAESSLCEMRGEVARRPWQLLLIPGEDGFFFLPLLWVGVSFVSAFAASALFAASHLCCKPPYACVGTFVMAFVLCLLVLPHGILNFAAGHLTVDAVIFALLFLRRGRFSR